MLILSTVIISEYMKTYKGPKKNKAGEEDNPQGE